MEFRWRTVLVVKGVGHFSLPDRVLQKVNRVGDLISKTQQLLR